MVNSNKIKDRMIEKRITQKKMAFTLGMAQPTLCQKINNVRPMSLEDAEKISNLLDISSKDFPGYFFSS